LAGVKQLPKNRVSLENWLFSKSFNPVFRHPQILMIRSTTDGMTLLKVFEFIAPLRDQQAGHL
jgi:hypothetical protein